MSYKGFHRPAWKNRLRAAYHHIEFTSLVRLSRHGESKDLPASRDGSTSVFPRKPSWRDSAHLSPRPESVGATKRPQQRSASRPTAALSCGREGIPQGRDPNRLDSRAARPPTITPVLTRDSAERSTVQEQCPRRTCPGKPADAGHSGGDCDPGPPASHPPNSEPSVSGDRPRSALARERLCTLLGRHRTTDAGACA